MRTRKATNDPGSAASALNKAKAAKEKDRAATFTINYQTEMHGHAWLPVTSPKSGHIVYVPLPIRLIVQIPDEKGGGCIIRGAHGDEQSTKENIVEILGLLGGFPLKPASSWSLAG